MSIETFDTNDFNENDINLWEKRYREEANSRWGVREWQRKRELEYDLRTKEKMFSDFKKGHAPDVFQINYCGYTDNEEKYMDTFNTSKQTVENKTIDLNKSFYNDKAKMVYLKKSIEGHIKTATKQKKSALFSQSPEGDGKFNYADILHIYIIEDTTYTLIRTLTWNKHLEEWRPPIVSHSYGRYEGTPTHQWVCNS